MTDNVSGHIHSIDTGGMVDGPGVRYVVFFQGCNMRCVFCHNPDTWEPGQRESNTMTVQEIVADIKKYQSYMRFTGGGITITGGEPFLQPQFLVALLRACKDAGIHTVLDTAGHASLSTAEAAFAHTDLLLLSIKAAQPQKHKEICGVSGEKTRDLLALAHKKNIPTWVRYVLVPGLTDSPEELRALADYLAPFDNVQKIEVLPFHKMGEHKWESLATPYTLAKTPPPTPQQVQVAKEILGPKAV